MDHDDYLPHYVLLTAARASDVRMAHHFDLPPGSIVAVDRGYNDFRLFARWIAAGVYFVIRPMHHMVYEVMESPGTTANQQHPLRSDDPLQQRESSADP